MVGVYAMNIMTNSNDKLEDSTLIEFTEKDEVRGSKIVCRNDVDCHVLCQGHTSCHGTYILCPQNANCYLECSGRGSCEDAVIFGVSSNHLMYIECIADYACWGSWINVVGKGHVIAAGERSSRQMAYSVINATNAKSLNIKASGWEVLKNSNILWPIGVSQTK